MKKREMTLHRDVVNKRTIDRFQTLEHEYNTVHSSRYSYKNCIYKNNETKIVITCFIHGDFEKLPNAHKRGQGCPVCATIQKSIDIKHREGVKFIDRAAKVHDNKYDYSKVNYTGDKKPVDIICPHHGLFSQLPSDHKQGRGCNQCADEYRGFNRSGYKGRQTILYILQVDHLFKIGITSGSIEKRYSFERNNTNIVLTILRKFIYEEGTKAYDMEKLLLRETYSNKYVGPKILNGGDSELRTKLDLRLIDTLVSKQKVQQSELW